MPRNQLEDDLKNLARGDVGYRPLRHRIFNSISTHIGEKEADLSIFLRNKLFTLKTENWLALAFDPKDFIALDRMIRSKDKRFDAHYTSLLIDYISANAGRVIEMYKKCALISKAARNNDEDLFTSVTATIDPIDQQSLFYFRVRSAQFAFSSELLEQNLKPLMKTGWSQNRFLYPLIYHALNVPVESNVDHFLSYVITGHEGNAEKLALKFLLRDDLSTELPIGFKAYLALSCHPYDACEQILNHIELSLCQKSSDYDRLIDLLRKIVAIAPSERATALLNIFCGEAVKFSTSPSPDNLIKVLGFDEPEANAICDFLNTSHNVEFEKIADIHGQLLRIKNMRSHPYPTRGDFDQVTIFARQWWFCDSGRFIGSLLTSLYMISRRNADFELRDMLRLTGFMQQLLPFIITSPSGEVLLQDRFVHLRDGYSADDIEQACEENIAEVDEYSDRFWIKAVHWRVRELQRRVKMTEWLREIRRYFEVKPAYLTGIDWSWVRSVIEKQRLRVFLDNPDGLYVLLLMKVEEYDESAELLRVAAESYAEGRTFDQFLEWLIDEYKEQAVAFVRYLLLPDEILLLRLEANKTAALAARITALQRCVRLYGYSETLPEELFKQEWESLNSTLLLMSVNTGQFEIPWKLFQKDVAAKEIDLYTAVQTFQPAEDLPAILSEAKTRVIIQFRNGRVEEYRYTNRLVPMASVVFSIIDSFLEHSSFGLEVLLSTRFRHDTMRREYAAVIEQTASAIIPSVGQNTLREILQRVENTLLREVDLWLNEYMHSQRPEQPNGLFNVIPNQNELLSILEDLDPDTGLEPIISYVSAWLYTRLDQQLPPARETFQAMMRAAFEERISELLDELLLEGKFRESDVRTALNAVQSNLMRKTEDLGGWFNCNSDVERTSLSILELKLAVDLLFESFRSQRNFKATVDQSDIVEYMVPPEKVRICFDLLREVFAGAEKHSRPRSAIIRMTQVETSQGIGFRFSNLNPAQESKSYCVRGHPYESLSDVVFREGESGLAKIAAMSATLYGGEIDIEVCQRKYSFHIDVIFWPHETEVA